MTEEQLRALLRLKRYEQPPPGYYDQLLRDIHRRQRAELLRRPLWKIALERTQTFFGEHSMSPASYAGAMATLMIFGVGAISLMTPGKPDRSGISGAALVDAGGGSTSRTLPHLNLQGSLVDGKAAAGFGTSNTRSASPSVQVVRHPRYVIDARPVSYEPTSSF